MASNQLQDIDVDKQFEERSVEEIEKLLRNIDNEIERKKEELRTLVGERYRDLIEAADKIKEMKHLSMQVINGVGEISSSLVQAQKKYQISSNADPNKSTTLQQPDDPVEDAIVAQISVLIELPEMIWSSVSHKDYVKAAELFLLGRHVKTSFDVDKRYKEHVKRLAVLEDLWRALAHFPNTIVSSAEDDLKTVDVEHRTAAICLASIHLLQNVCVLERFLTLRMDALRCSLSEDRSPHDSIPASVSCIVNTISILGSCFLDQPNAGSGLVWQLLGRNHFPVDLLERTVASEFLPPIITNFKLTASSAAPVSASVIETRVTSFLDSVSKLVAERGTVLLAKVNTFQDLNTLKNGYKSSAVEWDSSLQAFGGKIQFSLWDGLYRQILAGRTKELISMICDAMYKNVTFQVEEALANDDSARSHIDLRWFIWKESEDDLEMRGNYSKNLLLKSKAIIPQVAKICQAFDDKLNSFYSDLAGFHNSEDILSAEAVELRNHQQDMCQNMILKLKEFVRDVVAREGMTESKLSLIARFLQAIPDLCPMLQKCLTVGETKGDSWHDVKLLLNAESMFCWGLWEERAVSRMRATHLEQMGKSEATYADLLSVIPQWDISWIEEDEERKSQLKVPSSPSLNLQSTLHSITTDLSRAHLPRLISESVTQKLLPFIFERYDAASFLCPSESLQALFDLRFLAALYIPLTNKDLSSSCHAKISQLEAAIDPIDLEVYSPLIRTKVKEAIHRTQGMFSTSFASSEDNASLKIADAPCILALSKSASSVWFPSLPLANPSNRPLHIVKPKAVKIGKQINETDTAKTSTLSAASFFSDWFG
ncbi:unnamed protein product [Nesidiocoris tenuis]|uniref:Conserved oligomeric Golgi complex subunit 1 n=1 Tax=Nesidiocoris tenuis TaxID=355587 RepID=A0A6H5HQY8_9HEMI|nr:unnamed protein product [Nesidiocoris tenuis]